MKLIQWFAHTYHWCIGCEQVHPLPSNWTRTGPDEAPSYSPSFLQHTKRGPCHYIITDGVITYCGDCFHSFAGKVMPMPDVPEKVVASMQKREAE